MTSLMCVGGGGVNGEHVPTVSDPVIILRLLHFMSGVSVCLTGLLFLLLLLPLLLLLFLPEDTVYALTNHGWLPCVGI